MSEKGGRWNNVEFITSLMMSFYNELKGDGLSKEKKDAIEVRLRGQGFEDVTWNGIRVRLLPSQLSRVVLSSLSHVPLASTIIVSTCLHHNTPNYINVLKNEVTMADKSGKWNNPVLLESLVMAFHGLAKSADGLTKESKDAVVAKAHLWGFTDITWEGIRFIPPVTMSRNVMRWTPEVDQQILIALIKAINPTAEQYDTLITMSRHYQKWTPEIDQQILAAMVKVMIPTAEQYNAIMQELEPCGYGFTAITMK
ncbi:hypothetical protein CGLO_11489 [Colletotrichum gloeosporioides Cg-14]|uniref:Uncharacterized protein n=1 Tax=Colletotrichum gloeosporioides (strain Cg-14) TaxID=1237896 RepID=T0LBR2_COLGC|nr:hypothetical protein CGLO_11489 [Colletotrichum gloeosporioides Cg-14]